MPLRRTLRLMSRKLLLRNVEEIIQQTFSMQPGLFQVSLSLSLLSNAKKKKGGGKGLKAKYIQYKNAVVMKK